MSYTCTCTCYDVLCTILMYMYVYGLNLMCSRWQIYVHVHTFIHTYVHTYNMCTCTYVRSMETAYRKTLWLLVPGLSSHLLHYICYVHVHVHIIVQTTLTSAMIACQYLIEMAARFLKLQELQHVQHVLHLHVRVHTYVRTYELLLFVHNLQNETPSADNVSDVHG